MNRSFSTLFPKRPIRPVVLVDFPHQRPGDPAVSLGHANILATLTARLRARGVPVDAKVMHKAFDVSDDTVPPAAVAQRAVEFVASALPSLEWRRGVPEEKPLIGLGAFTWNERHVQAVLPLLRDALGGQCDIVLGGPQVSYADLGSLEHLYGDVQYFIRGYADGIMSVLAGLPFDPGTLQDSLLGLHRAGQVDDGAQAAPNLSELASPLLTLPATATIGDAVSGRRMVRWETVRGCPFACEFCQHRAGGFSPNAFAARRIEDEIGLLRSIDADETQPPLAINVLDPTFNGNTAHAVTVLNLFTRSDPPCTCTFRGQLKLQTRPELLKSAFLRACQATQARVHLELGVQSIVPEELATINRVSGGDPNKIVKKMEQKFAMLREVMREDPKITAEVSLIYGLPFQTPASFHRSIQWCQEHLPGARLVAFPLMLLRGTPFDFHRNRKRYGFVEDKVDPDAGTILPLASPERLTRGIPHVVAANSFTTDQWREMAGIARGLRMSP